tara:strand:- start:3250 stop:3897 length:648 start_codon:yes stop_codon:yes gene_type:complete
MNDSIQVTTLDLMRHGECEDGAIFRGNTDSLLSETGKRKMLEVANNNEALHWQAILSSPLQRCQFVAEQLAQQHELSLHTHNALQEISFGDWDGQSFSAVERDSPAAFAQYWQDRETHTPPNGEPLAQFHQRVKAVLSEILKHYRGQHLLIVTHGGVIRSLLAHCLQMPIAAMQHIEVPPCCRSQIKIYHSTEHKDWMQLIYHNTIFSKGDITCD